ncbi:ubiquitin C-terminal hydrolase [Coprinopsis sp. MPI-PUGE-AT-0042]|nr:ubiquitin C-terminal hydrolase [Coprinopsis sp. MPI-PUGE-AT-0042]
MARSRWMSFAAQTALSKDGQKAPPPSNVVVPPLPLAEVKKFGLENFGNTCYANSVLQALYFCTPFRDLMLQALDPSAPQDLLTIPIASALTTSTKPHPRRVPERTASSSVVPTESALASVNAASAAPMPPSPPTLFSALRSLFVHLSTQPGDKGTVAPKAFIDKLKELNELFRSTMHQDAHEFLNYLLNRIVEEMEEERKQKQSSAAGEDLSASIPSLGSKGPSANSTAGAEAQDATLVHRLFEGILTSETRCLTCETVSSRDESFLDLSIDIEQNSSVTACLRQFSASEMLCNRNKFFCDSCCDLQEAEKRMKIKKLPNVLALHLKRFKYQEDVGRYIKLTYRVAFPMDLRLFNTVDDMEDADRLYHLFAIVVHIGNGPHHGHYISIIKNGGTWLVFDDDHVSSITESEIPKYFGDSNAGSAYVLYYQADDIDLVSLGVRRPDPPSPPPEIRVEIPGSRSPQTVNKDLLEHPPGLETPDEIDEEVAQHEAGLTVVEPSSIRPIQPISDPPPQSAPSTPASWLPPFMTIKRAPSASLGKSNGPADARKATSDRSPRPSASSPSLFVRDETVAPQSPPPVPPLPQFTPTPILAPAPAPQIHINGDGKKEDKPKKETKTSGGWFKRKSFKLSEKAKTPTSEIPSPGPPPSPSRRNGDTPSTPKSHWFGSSSSSHPQKDGQTSSSGKATSNGSHLDLPPRANGGSLSPNDETVPSTPASASSSLNSPASSHPTYGSLRPSTASSSISRRQSLGDNSARQPKPASGDSSPHHRARQFPSSKKSGDVDRSLPPLPQTPPAYYHHAGPHVNGHQPLYEEPDSVLSDDHDQRFQQDPFSRPPPPPHSMSHSDTYSKLNQHQRGASTSLPPPLMTTAASVNTSSGSNSSSTSGLRKATRKLSLGFGRSREKK